MLECQERRPLLIFAQDNYCPFIRQGNLLIYELVNRLLLDPCAEIPSANLCTCMFSYVCHCVCLFFLFLLQLSLDEIQMNIRLPYRVPTSA